MTTVKDSFYYCNDHEDDDIGLDTKEFPYGNISLGNSQNELKFPYNCGHSHIIQEGHFDYGEVIDKASDLKKKYQSKSGYTSDTLHHTHYGQDESKTIFDLWPTLQKHEGQENFIGKTEKSSVKEEDKQDVMTNQTKNALVNNQDQHHVRNKTINPLGKEEEQQHVRENNGNLSGYQYDQQHVRKKTKNSSGNQDGPQHLRNNTTPLLNGIESQSSDLERGDDGGDLNTSNRFGRETRWHYLKRYWKLLMPIAIVMVVAIVLTVVFIPKSPSNRNDNKATESSADTPLPVTSIDSSMQLKKRNDNDQPVSAQVALFKLVECGKENVTVFFLNNMESVSSSSVQHVKNVKLEKDGYEIIVPGIYRLYFSIHIKLAKNQTCSDFGHKFKFHLLRTNKKDLSINNMFCTTIEMCCDGNTDFEQTVKGECRIQLQVDDFVQLVSESNKSPIYFTERSSFFGLEKD